MTYDIGKQRNSIDIILMETDGKGVPINALKGNVAEKVQRHSRRPVFVIPFQTMGIGLGISEIYRILDICSSNYQPKAAFEYTTA